MSKKVLIISSSPRKGGNSDILCDRFMEGAKESGNEVVKIRLSEKNIHYCSGCGYCNSKKQCSQKDEMQQLYENLIWADVIVLATPVYFYSMCAQLKTFIDRCCPVYTKLQNKEFYFIVTAADSDESMTQRTIEGLRGFTEDCLDNAIEKDIIYGVSAWQVGEIKRTRAYNKAFDCGKGL